MKTFWTMLSVIAVANLLAIGGFVGWLAKSDRLDMDRTRALRAMLSKTISKEKEEAAAATAKAAEDDKAAAAAKLAARPPLTAAERLQARIEATELDTQRAERLRREVADLQKSLAEERSKLDSEKKELAAAKEEFKQTVLEATSATTDAQFQKTLNVLQSLKPTQAVVMLKQMISDGEPVAADPAAMAAVPGAAPVANSGPATVGAGVGVTPPANKSMGLVVSYLDSMDEKHRAKVMTELAKSDPKLAADLLERIRKVGEFARVP